MESLPNPAVAGLQALCLATPPPGIPPPPPPDLPTTPPLLPPLSASPPPLLSPPPPASTPPPRTPPPDPPNHPAHRPSPTTHRPPPKSTESTPPLPPHLGPFGPPPTRPGGPFCVPPPPAGSSAPPPSYTSSPVSPPSSSNGKTTLKGHTTVVVSWIATFMDFLIFLWPSLDKSLEMTLGSGAAKHKHLDKSLDKTHSCQTSPLFYHIQLNSNDLKSQMEKTHKRKKNNTPHHHGKLHCSSHWSSVSCARAMALHLLHMQHPGSWLRHIGDRSGCTICRHHTYKA